MSRLLLVVAALAGLGPPVRAQNVDSLARLLDSADWRVRSGAVSGLSALAAPRFSASVTEKIIHLLEREALHREPTGAGGEGHGEYEISLVELALQLHDPRTLRGMALLGIQTSRAAQTFVASQGSAALPYLAAAWTSDTNARSAVVSTWAMMLGTFAQALTPSDQADVRARIFAADSLDLAFAAEEAPLPEAVPMLAAMSQATASPMLKQELAGALRTLRPLRDRLTASDLIARVQAWRTAFCNGAAGRRAAACEALGARLTVAASDVLAGRTLSARSVLSGIADASDAAFREGALTSLERTFVSENARYLAARL